MAISNEEIRRIINALGFYDSVMKDQALSPFDWVDDKDLARFVTTDLVSVLLRELLELRKAMEDIKEQVDLSGILSDFSLSTDIRDQLNIRGPE